MTIDQRRRTGRQRLQAGQRELSHVNLHIQVFRRQVQCSDAPHGASRQPKDKALQMKAFPRQVDIGAQVRRGIGSNPNVRPFGSEPHPGIAQWTVDRAMHST